MGSFIWKSDQAQTRFTSRSRLPLGRYGRIINTLVLVEGDREDTGEVDPDTCRPILRSTTWAVGLSMEMVSKAGQYTYETYDSDSRRIRLEGGFIGLGSLPHNLFTGGHKTVLFAYSGSECDPVWCKFTGDVQSLGSPSLRPSRRLSLPVSVSGEVHFRPINIDEFWSTLIHG